MWTASGHHQGIALRKERREAMVLEGPRETFPLAQVSGRLDDKSRLLRVCSPEHSEERRQAGGRTEPAI